MAQSCCRLHKASLPALPGFLLSSRPEMEPKHSSDGLQNPCVLNFVDQAWSITSPHWPPSSFLLVSLTVMLPCVQGLEMLAAYRAREPCTIPRPGDGSRMQLSPWNKLTYTTACLFHCKRVSVRTGALHAGSSQRIVSLRVAVPLVVVESEG